GQNGGQGCGVRVGMQRRATPRTAEGAGGSGGCGNSAASHVPMPPLTNPLTVPRQISEKALMPVLGPWSMSATIPPVRVIVSPLVLVGVVRAPVRLACAQVAPASSVIHQLFWFAVGPAASMPPAMAICAVGAPVRLVCAQVAPASSVIHQLFWFAVGPAASMPPAMAICAVAARAERNDELLFPMSVMVVKVWPLSVEINARPRPLEFRPRPSTV